MTETSRIARRLAGLELADHTGRRRPLDSFWRERPAVLVFIRHFG